jgi:hypothetical protein
VSFARRIASVSLLVLVASVILAAARPGPALAEPAGERLAVVREEARRLRADAARAVDSARDAGRPWSRAALFEGRGELLSASTLEFLRERRAAAADSIERRLLEILELDLARWTLEAAVAPLDERIAALGSSLTAEVEDVDNSLTLNELTARIPVESDSLRCRMLLAARAGLWGARVDPLLLRRAALQDSLARALGYPNHTGLVARSLDLTDVREVAAQLLLFTRATEPMYRLLAGEFLGVPERRALAGRFDLSSMKVREFHRRSEFDVVFRGFEAELLSRATHDLGLAPFTPAGVPAISAPPGLLDLAREPSPGAVPALLAGFRAEGEARHRALEDEPRAEFREAGPGTIPRATGELLAGLLMTPAWLQQWRETSASAERQEPARWGDPSIARYVRWRIWCELDRIRVDLAATLLHDLVAHDAGDEVWGPFFLVPPATDSPARWRQLLADSRGGAVAADEAWDHALRVQNHLAAAESARALGLAATIEESLVAAHGDDWFRKPEARQALRERLHRVSAATTADDLARAWGEDDLNLEPLRRRFERLLDWTDTAGSGQRR